MENTAQDLQASINAMLLGLSYDINSSIKVALIEHLAFLLEKQKNIDTL